MAESPYRKYQDANEDGIHDMCLEVEKEPIVEECPDSYILTANPNACTLDWRRLLEPFKCLRTLRYSVTLITEYKGTGGALLDGRLNESIESGVVCLMQYYGKAQSDENIATLRESAIIADWHVGGDSFFPRPGTNMKVLLVIPAFIFDAIEDESHDI